MKTIFNQSIGQNKIKLGIFKKQINRCFDLSSCVHTCNWNCTCQKLWNWTIWKSHIDHSCLCREKLKRRITLQSIRCIEELINVTKRSDWHFLDRSCAVGFIDKGSGAADDSIWIWNIRLPIEVCANYCSHLFEIFYYKRESIDDVLSSSFRWMKDIIIKFYLTFSSLYSIWICTVRMR